MTTLERVFALAPLGEAGPPWLAATAAGVFRCEAEGQPWQSLLPEWETGESLAATALGVSPDLRREPTLLAGVTGGVLLSRDAGKTWEPVRLSAAHLPAVTVLACSPDFANDGVVLAGTLEDGLFRSPDRGRHWYPWNFGLLDLRVLSLALSPNFAVDETALAGTESGLFRSRNGGRAWRETAFPAEAAPILSLAFGPAGGPVLAGTEAAGVFRSLDGGAEWQPADLPAEQGPVNCVAAVPGPAPLSLALLPDSVWLSEDTGSSWRQLETRTRFQDAASLAAWRGPGQELRLLIGLAGGGVLWL